MQLIFERSVPGRRAVRVPAPPGPVSLESRRDLCRAESAALPEVSELDAIRHFTGLSQRNFSVDTHMYPLGSCTMKYNPRACEVAAALPGFADLHPLLPQLPRGEQATQGALRLLYELERMLSEICGMAESTLQPLAGAHGELTGVMLMAAYHRDHGRHKTHLLVPDAAHGTNPASARHGGYDVVTIPSRRDHHMDVDRLLASVRDDTAGVMLTCPDTLGAFPSRLAEIADAIHRVDGLLYYDGANLNAILGRCRPGRMGFDICHVNLHKTFATPHGGGGPGAGPVGVVEKLRPYLPISRVRARPDGSYYLDYDAPKSIGYIAPFYGNFGVLVRAYAYLRLLGREGLRATSDMAVLNANYVQERLRPHLEAVNPGRCMHECVFSGRRLTALGIHTLDLAKALIDRGIHPPTICFPTHVPEAVMIEPTETESRETLDRFCDAVIECLELAARDPTALKSAPRTTPVGRLDEIGAARRMDLAWTPRASADGAAGAR